MRLLVATAIFCVAIASAHGGSVLINSPDHAQTFAYGEMIWHQLSVDSAGTLIARITFSNLPYAGSHEARFDESFDFRFPGVRIDRGNRTVFIRDRRGEQIRLGRYCGNPAHGWVDLTAEAKIYLLKERGSVTAVLTATSEPRSGMRWIQMNDNWSLQNLILRLGQS